METQNEQLEKILKLIQENFEAKKISNKDLNEIIFYSAGLVKVENLGLVQWKLDDGPPEEAENAKKLFVTNFGKNPALANKIFRFESKLISDLLLAKKDLDVYFSQDTSGNLCIVLKAGTVFYEITTSSTTRIDDNLRQTRSNLFKGKLKSTIETTLKKSYTEYVTIPFISNFDQFKDEFPQTIVLVPAISVTKYAGRMTLVMNFEDFSGKTIFEKVGDTSYDTFSPHP